MCLVFKTRCSTKDIDGIFAPAAEMRKAIANVGHKLHIREDWLNDAAKRFFTNQLPKQDVINHSHLRIWTPTAEYMLAMKSISARYDSYDKEDLLFLIEHLNLKTSNDVFNIITKYYPEENIPIKTRFFVEEILQNDHII